MSYTVIKTIKGRRYRYLQTSWREGTRVRTKNVCLGPLDPGGRDTQGGGGGGLVGFLKAQRLSPEDRAMAVAERAAAKTDDYQRENFGETAHEREKREAKERFERIYTDIGLKAPTHQEAPQEAPQTETAPSDQGVPADEGQAEAGDEGLSQ